MVSSAEMGLGAKGRMKQRIYPDPHGSETVESARSQTPSSLTAQAGKDLDAGHQCGYGNAKMHFLANCTLVSIPEAVNGVYQ